MTERLRPRAPLAVVITLFVVLFLLYVPTIVMVANSLMVKTAEQWSFGLLWYFEILRDVDLLSALGRSLVVGLTSSFMATVLGAAAAIALTRTAFRGRKILMGLSFLSLLVPELVFALALLTWFYVLKIPLSLLTVIVSHVTFSLSFVLMTVNGRLDTMDNSVEDAGRDLGASEWTILRLITLPLLMPAILSGLLLAFLISFDDFLITFFVSGVGSDTLPIRLYVAMKTGLSPKLSALSTLMMGISLVVIVALVQLRRLRSSN